MAPSEQLRRARAELASELADEPRFAGVGLVRVASDGGTDAFRLQANFFDAPPAGRVPATYRGYEVATKVVRPARAG